MRRSLLPAHVHPDPPPTPPGCRCFRLLPVLKRLRLHTRAKKYHKHESAYAVSCEDEAVSTYQFIVCPFVASFPLSLRSSLQLSQRSHRPSSGKMLYTAYFHVSNKSNTESYLIVCIDPAALISNSIPGRV